MHDRTSIGKALTDFLSEQLPHATDIRVEGLYRSGTGTSRENWPFVATWAISTRTERHPLLLRRDPPSSVIDTDRAAEFALLRALEPTDVPAPHAWWLDDTGEWFGLPSMIVERYEGHTDRGMLRDRNPLGLTQAKRVSLAQDLCDVLAGIHTLDPERFGLTTFMPDPGTNPAEQQLREWEDVLAACQLEPQPALRLALRWLREHLAPPPAKVVLVHGDFRPANVLINSEAIETVLDWELAHLSDPLDDLGWYCTPIYSREHFVPDMWEETRFLERYAQRTGLSVDRQALRFWKVFAIFRLAVMALTGVRNFCDGTTDRPAAPATAVTQRLLTEITNSTADTN